MRVCITKGAIVYGKETEYFSKVLITHALWLRLYNTLCKTFREVHGFY